MDGAVGMKAMQEETLAKMDAHHDRTEGNHEEMMAKLDVVMKRPV
jgi:hypothetical protein